MRRQILVAVGLWPMPTKTPLNAVIHGKIDRGDYTIEKVYFESAPGFFVTGNLYRPKNIQGRVPGVMFAHGHRENARFYLTPDGLRKVIRPAVEVLIGRALANAGDVERRLQHEQDRGEFLERTGTLLNKTYGEEVVVIQARRWPAVAAGRAARVSRQPRAPSGRSRMGASGRMVEAAARW